VQCPYGDGHHRSYSIVELIGNIAVPPWWHSEHRRSGVISRSETAPERRWCSYWADGCLAELIPVLLRGACLASRQWGAVEADQAVLGVQARTAGDFAGTYCWILRLGFKGSLQHPSKWGK